MTYLLHDKKIIYIRPHKTVSTTIADHCAELPESELYKHLNVRNAFN
mgnify:CR=1 FL=1